MNKVYRIYTENVNREDIIRIVGEHFEGFTLLNGVGYWQGTPEQSLVIEIIGTEKDSANVELVAYKIKKNNHQQAVLVQETNITANLV